MYESFYGLREKPFNPTPDPRFLYLGAGHREALAQLEYCVRERRGFALLTGEVGTGKTTLLQCLLGRLDEDVRSGGRWTETAYVFNSLLAFDDLLAYVVEDFGISEPAGSTAERMTLLNRFLLEIERSGRNALLIIDEAQNLDVSTLEHVRLLTNFETPRAKLLQVLLVGQPELRQKLGAPELRQLRQRISIRAEIEPLSLAESLECLRHRLAVARGSSDGDAEFPFTSAAARRLARYSRGIPRTLNLVCDHALLLGYADQRPTVDIETAAEAIRYVDRLECSSKMAGARRPLGSFAHWVTRWYPRSA
jgi:general secretion pathway protein A